MELPVASFERVSSFLPYGFRQPWEIRPTGADVKECWLLGECEATAQSGE